MRAAATLILARTGAHGLEVLLVKRGEAGDFPGLHVFPGGLVDAADAQPSLANASLRSEHSADQLLAGRDTLPSFIAAVREALEEIGVMLAFTADDAHPDAATLRDWQQRLLAREITFADLVTRADLKLATDQLGYFSHWITPTGIPRRYDTRFFVAPMPSGQIVQVDGREAVTHEWLRPTDALAANERGDIRLIFPTIRNLEALTHYDSLENLLADCLRPRQVPAILPKIIGRAVSGKDGAGKDGGGKDASGLRLLLPGDVGYDEA